MSVSEVEILAGLHLGDLAGAGAGDLFLSQLENADPSWNPEVVSVIAAGDIFPKFVGLQGNREEVPFSTGQVAAAITRLGNLGDNVSPSKLFYRTVSNLDGLEAAGGAVHSVFTVTEGFAYLMSLSAGHRKQASLRGRLVPVFDGTNEPIARVGNGTLTETPTANEVFQLGPVVYPGGTIIEGVDDLELNWNPQVFELSDESQTKTTFCAIQPPMSPVLSFTATDRDVQTLAGEVLGFRFHLVRMKNHDESYTSVETQHIKCEISHGILVKSAKQGSPTGTRMELHVAGDPAGGYTANPISWTVNSAFDLT